MKTSFKLSSLTFAVLTAMSVVPQVAHAEEDDTLKSDIEVIEIVGRQRSAATAVVEDRRQQAVVADLMGADMISRTGDSDAAAALRRITGLTLVQDKFIYVRGLGERYSSTMLNGAQIPSPDPTRNVIPLDMFPAGIIESLVVQKAYSPDMPAAFGGGNVNIRTKAIPLDFTWGVQVGTGHHSLASEDALSYADGERDFPKPVADAAAQYGSLQLIDIAEGLGGVTPANLAKAEQINRDLGLAFNRNMTIDRESTKTPYDVSGTIGNRFALGKESVFGVMLGGSYEQESKNFKEQERYHSIAGDGSLTPLEKFDDIIGTEHSEKTSGMFNLGFELNDYHKIESATIYLKDISDKITNKVGETIETINEADLANDITQVLYEERTLLTNQLTGKHAFPELYDVAVEWHYTDARAERKAPNELEYRYYLQYNEQNQLQSKTLRKSDNAVIYQYGNLRDDTEDYGYVVGLPMDGNNYVLTLEAGYNYFERSRNAETRRYKFDTRNFTSAALQGQYHEVFSDANITNPDFKFQVSDVTTRADDYVAAQMLDAAFVSFDTTVKDEFRINGGVRYEEFKQVAVPLNPETGAAEGNIADYSLITKDYFPSLSGTWILSDQTQYRLGIGQTVTRPDIREVTPVLYIDPETNFKVKGYEKLVSADMTNLDFRYEYYGEQGTNLSVGVFYKKIDNPIETIELQGSDGDRLISFRNAQDGKVYGVETEFLTDFALLGEGWQQLFLAGNVTLSDSEINIQPLGEAALTNLNRRMTGHSNYVVNLQLGYDSADEMHSASLAYNVSGERIAFAGTNGKDDAYEQPFHSLDFVYSYNPTPEMKVKFSFKNILDEQITIEQQGEVLKQKEVGQSLGLSFSYDFN